ncbi:MAG: hypothetical protein PVF58_08160 [Candidatus Methanofastidiosia archaeon]|jgi:hypothetical protein
MYPVRTRFNRYRKSIYGTTHSLEGRIPTFAGTLDRYFDVYFEDIIEEWELLTDRELRTLENRLTRVTDEINQVYTQKSDIEKRVMSLKAELDTLEEEIV